MNQTLAIIKPDAVTSGNTGKIIAHLENAGFSIKSLKLTVLNRVQAEAFYSVHKEKPFFKDLVAYMVSSPVMIQILEGESAIATNRRIMGATDPSEAVSGSIRADFAESIEKNIVHGSDGKETASQEIEFFFGIDGVCF